MSQTESVLIFDIETDSLDIQEANLKFFTAVSLLTGEKYFLTYKDSEQIAKLIATHKVLVPFNGNAYDIPIIKKLGVSFEYKMSRDLFNFFGPRAYGKEFKGWATTLGIKLNSYSLDNICKILKLNVGHKLEIDYNIFKKDEWTEEELKLIKEYCFRDIDLTIALYEWCEKFFEPLKSLMSSEDVRKKVYLKSTAASLGYSIICNLSGMPVEWSDEEKEETFAGGHFIEPRFEKCLGPIYSLDVRAAYPHAIIQANLKSRIKEEILNGEQ
jgi:DNA polymerase elongation subunit (family B)